MNLSDIRSLFRFEADDNKEPFFASNAEILEWANDAQNEACRRGRLLVDSTTAAICTISVLAATTTYALDPRVISLRRATLASDRTRLTLSSYRDFDSAGGSGARWGGDSGASAQWEDDTGAPTNAITDMGTGKIRLYPIPVATDTVRLTVVRLPLEELAADTDEPEINPRFHRNLRHWLLYRYYSKQDADTFDASKAAVALGLFESEFGKASRAIEEEWISRQQQHDPYDGIF